MRDYATVRPQFWTGETGRFLREAGVDAQVLALYLMTCPSSNMIGLYYLPLPVLCHETGLSTEGASEALRRASEGDFAHYDPRSETVWVVEMARYQVGEKLKADDKRSKGIADELSRYRKSPFYLAFHGRYGSAFHLPEASPLEAPPKPLAWPFDGPPKPRTGSRTGSGSGSRPGTALSAGADRSVAVASGGDLAEPLSSEKPSETTNSPACQVFDHWNATLQGGRARSFDGKRRSNVEARLKAGYTVADLCKAIDGCGKTPHNMGQNDRGERFDDLELICRDAAHVDRFIRNADSPPQAGQAGKGIKGFQSITENAKRFHEQNAGKDIAL